MADRKQWLKIVHVAKRQLRLTDDEYRLVMEKITGKRSAKDLDDRGFRQLMAEFERLGFKSTTTPKPKRSSGDLITAAQMAKLKKLYAILGWDIDAQRAFARRQLNGRAWPQTRAEGVKVIEGLRAIGQRRGLDVW